MGAEDDRIKFQQVVMPSLSEGYALARWIAGNQTDADDILQDACVRALRGIATYAGGSARAWTLTNADAYRCSLVQKPITSSLLKTWRGPARVCTYCSSSAHV